MANGPNGFLEAFFGRLGPQSGLNTNGRMKDERVEFGYKIYVKSVVRQIG